MAEISPSSTRSVLQATYTPIDASAFDDAEIGRPIDKVALVNALAIDAEERDKLLRLGKERGPDFEAAALEIVRAARVSETKEAIWGADSIAEKLSSIPASVIMSLTGELAALRENAAAAKSQVSHADFTRALLSGFRARLAIEPVGYLHLERLEFTPSGIERGELVKSLPVVPGEEIQVSYREWSNTTEEFAKIVVDVLEEYSEEGVTEKHDLAQASNSQRQHSLALSTSMSASGTYGPVSISASASLNINDSSSTSEQTSRTTSQAMTKRAASRATQEHKVSFKTSTRHGVEEGRGSVIRNPFNDRAVRYDYYQLVRRWRVQLLRYGCRLTYDLVVPEPGLAILDRIREIRAIEAELHESFGDPNASSAYARFVLAPGDITRNNYTDIQSWHLASVDDPPPEHLDLDIPDNKQWSRQQADTAEFHSTTIAIPDDYVLSSYPTEVTIHSDRAPWDPARFTWWVQGNESLLGKSRRQTIAWRTWNINSGYVRLIARAYLEGRAYEAWRRRAWEQIREAAQARYYERRQLLTDRLAQLRDEIAASDPLTLRKIEREEVMKSVLRWMLGRDFEFFPSSIDESEVEVDARSIDEAIRGRILQHGELAKFLHHAIEWENMNYFLYPYFWSHPNRWPLKKDLDHPDPLHQAFLKAGSARVVFPIRPGFERAFLSVVRYGHFDGPPPETPYFRIAEEFEAYARTNYPGIRSANPETAARPLLTPRQRRAWREIESVMGLLERFRREHDVYPTTAEGLAALAPLGVVPARDPWGRPYEYASPGVSAEYELWSQGSSGIEEGVAEEDARITSYAQASIIGRWYEYSPTSALDVAMNDTLPTT